eukprot:2430357-Prymnesium_polylepis.2
MGLKCSKPHLAHARGYSRRAFLGLECRLEKTALSTATRSSLTVVARRPRVPWRGGRPSAPR